MQQHVTIPTMRSSSIEIITGSFPDLLIDLTVLSNLTFSDRKTRISDEITAGTPRNKFTITHNLVDSRSVPGETSFMCHCIPGTLTFR